MEKSYKWARIFFALTLVALVGTLVAGLLLLDVGAMVADKNGNYSFTPNANYNYVTPNGVALVIEQDTSYTTTEEVSAYIMLFGNLPPNYVTKGELSSISDPNKFKVYSVGGDTFMNREGYIQNPNNLPMVEADIYSGNHNSGFRGAERLVFFADGSKVFYTPDHYNTFTQVTLEPFSQNSNAKFSNVPNAKHNLPAFVCLGVCALCILAQVVVLFVALFSRNKWLAKEWVLAVEIVVVSTLLFALSPVALLLFVLGKIFRRPTPTPPVEE